MDRIKSLSRALGCLSCEVRWYLGSGFHRQQQTSESLVRSRSLVRRLLRLHPTWLRGHLELGMLEVEAILVGVNRPEPREIATIRVSAKAAQVLDPSRYRWQGEYLQAMLSLFLKEFSEALSRFRKLLQDQTVPKGRVISLLESGAAAALAVGENEEAERYLARLAQRQKTRRRGRRHF